MNYTPAQRLAGHLLRSGASEEATVLLRRLASEFPDAERIPSADPVSKAVFKVLYDGPCTLDAFDLRTSGSYHDRLAPLVEMDGGDAAGLLEELVRRRDSEVLEVAASRGLAELAQGKSPQAVAEYLRGECGKLKAATKTPTLSALIANTRESLSGGTADGLLSGITELDRIFLMRRRQMVTVAAATGQGKTAWILRMVARVLVAGGAAAVLSLEDYVLLPAKLASHMSGVDISAFVRPDVVTDRERRRADDALEMLTQYEDKLKILPNATIASFEAEVKDWGADLVALDYVQKYVDRVKGTGDRRVDVGVAASMWQDAVQRLGCFGILASQVVRRERIEAGRGAPRKPQLYDLKESGDLENYSDAVLLLWWPWKERMSDNGDLAQNDYHLIVAKDRLGSCGEVRCLFDGATQTHKNPYVVEWGKP